MRVLVGLALVLLAAACSKGTDRDADGKLSHTEVAAEARKLRLDPGQWETTTRIDAIAVPGVSADMMKAATATPTTTANCITPAQAASPDANLLSGTADANCTYQRFSMADARIDAAMTCDPPGVPGTMAMTLAGSYAPTRFSMRMDMKSEGTGPAAVTMKATVEGRRIGACSQAANPDASATPAAPATTERRP